MIKKCGVALIASLFFGAMVQSADKSLKRKEHPQRLQPTRDHEKKICSQDEHTSQDSKEFWLCAQKYLDAKNAHRDQQLIPLIYMCELLEKNPNDIFSSCIDALQMTDGEKRYNIGPCYPLFFTACIAHSFIPQHKIITYERMLFEKAVALDKDHARRIGVIGYGVIWDSLYLVQYMIQTVKMDITSSPQIMKIFTGRCFLAHKQCTNTAKICTLLLKANADLSGVAQIAPSHLSHCSSCQLITAKKQQQSMHQESSSSSLSSSISVRKRKDRPTEATVIE